MGQNSERITHDLAKKNNIFRDVRLEQIVNDINEKLTSAGYVEVQRNGVFPEVVTLWDSPSKNKKRFEFTYTRTGPFITQVVEEMFDETTGMNVVATTTSSVVRDGNNRITDVTTGTVRA